MIFRMKNALLLNLQQKNKIIDGNAMPVVLIKECTNKKD